MRGQKLVIDKNKELFIEERKNEKRILNQLKNYPNIYNQYLIKKVFDEDEINLLKQIKNNRKK